MDENRVSLQKVFWYVPGTSGENKMHVYSNLFKIRISFRSSTFDKSDIENRGAD